MKDEEDKSVINKFAASNISVVQNFVYGGLERKEKFPKVGSPVILEYVLDDLPGVLASIPDRDKMTEEEIRELFSKKSSENRLRGLCSAAYSLLQKEEYDEMLSILYYLSGISLPKGLQKFINYLSIQSNIELDFNELAVDTCDLVLLDDPENTFAWYNRGLAKIVLKEYEEAARSFEMFEEHKVTPDADLYILKYMVYDALKDFEKALKSLDDEADLAPTEKTLYRLHHLFARQFYPEGPPSDEQLLTDLENNSDMKPYLRISNKIRLNMVEEE